MSCNVNTTRVVKMGIEYGEVQLLSTASLEGMHLQELANKGMKTKILPFTALTPLVNNFVVTALHDLASQEKVVLFTHPFTVKVVSSILNNVAVAWKIVCIDRETLDEAAQAFPNKDVQLVQDDANIGNAIKPIAGALSEVVIVGSNKLLPHYTMFIGAAGMKTEEIMVFQNTIKSSIIEDYYNGILFFDTLSVDSYFVWNTMPQNTVAFCINEAVANHLTTKLQQPTVVVQASQATKLSLIESVIVYYNR